MIAVLAKSISEELKNPPSNVNPMSNFPFIPETISNGRFKLSNPKIHDFNTVMSKFTVEERMNNLLEFYELRLAKLLEEKGDKTLKGLSKEDRRRVLLELIMESDKTKY